MKKLLLSCLAVISLGLFTASAFSMPVYQSNIESISDALNKTRLKSLTGRGLSTVITIINYTENTIVVDQPDGRVLTRLTADRIVSPDYDGQTRVVLRDQASGRVFFPTPGNSGFVSPFAVVSVYVSNQHYVVYVTE